MAPKRAAKTKGKRDGANNAGVRKTTTQLAATAPAQVRRSRRIAAARSEEFARSAEVEDASQPQGQAQDQLAQAQYQAPAQAQNLPGGDGTSIRGRALRPIPATLPPRAQDEGSTWRSRDPGAPIRRTTSTRPIPSALDAPPSPNDPAQQTTAPRPIAFPFGKPVDSCTRRDPSEESGQTVLVEPALATTAFRGYDITFKGDDHMMDMELEVREVEDETGPLLQYEATLYMAREGQARKTAGYIQAYRISKPTKSNPHIPLDRWTKLFTYSCGYLPDEPTPAELSLHETALCVQAMWHGEGNPRSNGTEHVPEDIDDHPLMYIKMIEVHEGWRRGQLVDTMIRDFVALLGRLPEWFAFRGVLFLWPAPPLGAAERIRMTRARYVKRLKGIYRRNGFEVWFENSHVVCGPGTDGSIDVMGRMI